MDDPQQKNISLRIGDEAAHEIVCRIRPTVAADKRRREVMEFIQGLIRDSLGYEVFPYGSVPLKTYLHDGDIDLTALSSPSIEDALVSDVHAILKREEQRGYSGFQVKGVHCIDAEVKLVKCLVDDIVVDVSFNQLGGLCTLCFLEQIDCLVGKDHLFKRSVILIKAWCYYESRILGAQYGLISTYALEILVLYIFHLFHSFLDGPLAVLYRFLDYYSKFDWEKYCISLKGPIRKSSLPQLVAEDPGNGGVDLLLSEEFIQKCVQMFSVESKRMEENSRSFCQKYLNIIDPLKKNNNLGRSVNRGNFYRIRSAFKHGACKLGEILLLPRERITAELSKFFANALERNQRNHAALEEDAAEASGSGDSGSSSSSSLSSLSAISDIYFGGTTFPTSLVDVFRGTKLAADHVISRDSNNGYVRHTSVISSTTDASFYEDSLSGLREEERTFTFGSSGSSKSLLDLTGDYESHLRSVLYGQRCHLFAESDHVLSNPLTSEDKTPWETVQRPLSSKQNACSQMSRNGMSGPEYSLGCPLGGSASSFSSKGNRRPQGTGTYIPNTCHLPSRVTQSSGSRVFHHTPGSWGHGYTHNVDSTKDPAMMALFREGSCELSTEEYPARSSQKSGSPGSFRPYPSVWCSYNVNGYSHSSQRLLSGSCGFQLNKAGFIESIWPDTGTLNSCDAGPNYPEPAAASPKRVPSNSRQSVAEPSFHLKNEVDFPPLALHRMVEHEDKQEMNKLIYRD